MKIIDLNPELEKLYFCCLEDWSEEIKEAGDHKACWYNHMKDKGLRVKLAQNDDGAVGGMIQYLPAEVSHIEGKDLYVLLCIWVHGHNYGRGNFQKRGMGSALLKAAEEDAKLLGTKGFVTWGLSLPFFMKASWFKKHGYHVVDKHGMMRLLWKPFTADAIAPQFFRRKKKPEIRPDKLTISLFKNGWCTSQNMVFERAKRAIAGFEDKIDLKEYNTLDRNVQQEWGITDALFINDKEVTTGPPLSYKKIRRMIERKVKRYR
jgi:N-acetylglutamate synthase-like GNAT family acetyltransferase